MVGYHFDGNAILATPINNRQARAIKEAQEVQHRNITMAGVASHIWIMDNDISIELKAVLK